MPFHLNAEETPEDKMPDATQTAVLVLRISGVLDEYLGQAPRLKLKIGTPDILSVIDHALLEADGKALALPWPNTTEGFFLSGAFEELIQQPGSIFEEVTAPDGTSQHVPLSTAIWKMCLSKLRQVYSARTPQSSTSAQDKKKPTTRSKKQSHLRKNS
jgi:hypothetical protein